MKSVQSLLSHELIEQLASRSNLRYGKQIAERGKILIDQPNIFNVEAKVSFSAHETRTIEYHATAKGLRWKCSCSNKKNFFCNHCAAVALVILKDVRP